MKPKRPVPQEQPFVTFVTSTFRRPSGLADLMATVAKQTAVTEIEHVVLPDHLGHSPADAVYGRMPFYGHMPRGEYVHVIGDDDQLASHDAVEKVKAFARSFDNPALIMVRAKKGPDMFPRCGLDGDFSEGDIDLCCFVIRREVFTFFAQSYGRDYKCDWDGYLMLRELAGEPAKFDFLFVVGKQGSGRPELDW